MEEAYTLTDLLRNDTKAMEFYDKLPDYVQEAIAQRPEGVGYFESLRHYADNLLAGDR